MSLQSSSALSVEMTARRLTNAGQPDGLSTAALHIGLENRISENIVLNSRTAFSIRLKHRNYFQD